MHKTCCFTACFIILSTHLLSSQADEPDARPVVVVFPLQAPAGDAVVEKEKDGLSKGPDIIVPIMQSIATQKPLHSVREVRNGVGLARRRPEGT